MGLITCQICGNTGETLEGQESLCVRCGADVNAAEQEIKIFEETRKGRFAAKDSLSAPGDECEIYLTNKRLVVIPKKIQGYGWRGKAAAALYNKVFLDENVISVPLSEVKAVRDGKFGLLVKAIIVDIAGDVLVKMVVSNQDEWKSTIARMI